MRVCACKHEVRSREARLSCCGAVCQHAAYVSKAAKQAYVSIFQHASAAAAAYVSKAAKHAELRRRRAGAPVSVSMGP